MSSWANGLIAGAFCAGAVVAPGAGRAGAFGVMKADGTISEWNERSAELFGWTRAEVVGRGLAEVIIPERYRPAHFEGLKRFLETGKAIYVDRRIELSALRRSGAEFPVELRISSIEMASETAFVGC